MGQLSSALGVVNIRQEPAPLIIGERLNAQGSRKAKQLVLDDDIDGLVALARQQVSDGAHCIDVCVATTERTDEKAMMLQLVKQLSLEIEAPLVIDSTLTDVVSSAVEHAPGKPLINSINLEGTGSRFTDLAPVMAKYGAPSIAMCIGPNGMAKTPQEKLDVAKLIYSKGKEYNLTADQFVFDVLTFTLGTGEAEYADAGNNTLDGIRKVHEEMPDSFTVLGLSNISFGLSVPTRRLLNSVFLYHAVRAGLDAVIVNIRDILPYAQIGRSESKLAENVIFNNSENAISDLISHFEGKAGGPTSYGAREPEIDPTLSASARCTFRVINRIRNGIEADVISAIAEKIPGQTKDELTGADPNAAHDAALETLNSDLLPAMKEVGDKFGAGEIILPFVLRSAECMKAAVVELERHLISSNTATKGTVVLGTVYGDVHDIGKNLVNTILVNNGYTVHDLGKQVPLQMFVEKIRETNADAVGLSALLVHTSAQMKEFVEYARKNDLKIPILCGGAAIHSNYINRIAKDGGIYPHGVFYCNTMFDGLDIMEKISTGNLDSLVSEWKTKLESWSEPAKPMKRKTISRTITPASLKTPPPLGKLARLDSTDIPFEKVWELVDKKSLFKMSWGVRGKAGARLEAEHETLYETWKAQVTSESLFDPHIVYGYFACHNRSNGRLEVDIPGSQSVNFEFPLVNGAHLSDYFGDDDVVAFQSVTVGQRVAKLVEEWNNENKYTDSYYLHGLAVEAAEALAAWTHQKIRLELGIGNSGLRYSWGYPSCPDLSQHALVWKLLMPEESGMTLTSHYQIVPEYSTAAIIIHHPDASY